MKLGQVESVWRYPVKSMAGEELQTAFVGFAGLYGDRVYSFRDPAAAAGFPFLTARARPEMITMRPRFRRPERVATPPDLAAAQALGPGITPLYAPPEDFAVDVTLADGSSLPLDSPELRTRLGISDITLVYSERALTDCRPVSLITTATIAQIAEECALALDPRRFRANFVLGLPQAKGFAEDHLIGRTLRIGDQVQVALLQRDPRCKMITLDPETGSASPEVLRVVAREHGGHAGVYAAVLVEGLIQPGDPVTLVGPPPD